MTFDNYIGGSLHSRILPFVSGNSNDNKAAVRNAPASGKNA